MILQQLQPIGAAPVDHSEHRAATQVSFSSNSLKRVLLSVSSGIMLDKHMMHSLHCPSVSNRCCLVGAVGIYRKGRGGLGSGQLPLSRTGEVGKVQPDFK